jgi:hypothetical protein
MLSGSSLGAQWELSGSSSQLRVFLYIVLQKATKMVDCDKGTQDCAKQQPNNFLVASQEQATKEKHQHHQRDDQVLMSYIILQEVTMTTIFFCRIAGSNNHG